MFYAIYFIVSFPMFFRLDENPKTAKTPLSGFVVNSLAAGMLVTILLDFWRLFVGNVGSHEASSGLPWGSA